MLTDSSSWQATVQINIARLGNPRHYEQKRARLRSGRQLSTEGRNFEEFGEPQ